MARRRPARVMYCEGNTDGTVGGSYYSLLFLLEGLDRARFSPVLVLRADTPLIERFRAAVGDVRVFPRPKPLTFGGQAARFRILARQLQRALNVGRFYVEVVCLAWWLRRERFDLVHLNNSVTSNHEWMMAAFLARIPCVTHERGLNDTYSPRARWCAPRLAAILCISQAVFDKLRDRGVSSRNLVLVPNGLDPARVTPERSPDDVRRSLGIGADRRVVGMVGNIREWKGQDIVVRALPRIREQVPDLTCVFVGEATPADAPYKVKLDGLIEALGLADHVRFTGYCPNVADPLATMEVAIHASATPEPFGRVLLEAMALRKPVVGSRGGAVTEIVLEGVTGLTFPPGDSEALARCVTELLMDPDRARQLGDAGRLRLEAEYHVRSNVAKTQAVHDHILGLAGEVRG